MEHGIVIMWSGSIATIPSGFVLCDGNNGTPDMRDLFVVGAGGAYNPGDAGGAINHNHPFTSDGHGHEGEPSGIGLLDGGTNAWGEVVADTGDTDNADGRPPYYALAYIMKT